MEPWTMCAVPTELALSDGTPMNSHSRFVTAVLGDRSNSLAATEFVHGANDGRVALVGSVFWSN